MWRVRTHGGNPAERAATRTGAATDRQGSRLGTTAVVPAMLCEGPSRGVDQVEGDGLNLGRVGLLRPLGPVFALSDSSDSKPSDAGRVSSRSCLTRAKTQWEERPMAIVRNIEV